MFVEKRQRRMNGRTQANFSDKQKRAEYQGALLKENSCVRHLKRPSLLSEDVFYENTFGWVTSWEVMLTFLLQSTIKPQSNWFHPSPCCLSSVAPYHPSLSLPTSLSLYFHSLSFPPSPFFHSVALALSLSLALVKFTQTDTLRMYTHCALHTVV